MLPGDNVWLMIVTITYQKKCLVDDSSSDVICINRLELLLSTLKALGSQLLTFLPCFVVTHL